MPEPGAPPEYDVAVIGAGVVGGAIARELSRFDLSVALVDAAPDVGTGTSKANTSILHTGFDASPGTLEAGLVRRGYELLRAHAERQGIPLEATGAMLVAWNDDELAALPAIQEKAVANGYLETRRLAPEEVYDREPHLGPGAMGGILVPGESIICTFTATLSFATGAVENGVALWLDSRVVDVTRGPEGGHHLRLADGRSLAARWVINAAGLGSDTIDRLFGHDRFTVTPRRGELIVFDKFARSLLDHIVLPVPTKLGKGVLVSPTVFGNVMLGPTAEDLGDRAATESTAAGVEGLLTKGRRIMPELLEEEVTAVYAGLRAATGSSDYCLFDDRDQRYTCVGGIRSTGLTASMAIAEHVVGLLREGDVPLRPREGWRAVRVPYIGEAGVRPYADAAAIARDPAYGRILCHCERVTMGEIRDAMTSPIPPRNLDGLRRRTRATMGRCGAFYCTGTVDALLRDAREAKA